MGNVEVAYVKIDVFVPETIFRRSICVKTKERVGRSKIIQTNLMSQMLDFS